MTERRPYSVAVVLADGDSSALLSVVSTLHRRAVDVLDAELTRPAAGRRSFTATFLATWKQARTVEESLRNLVYAVSVELSEPVDRSPDAAAEVVPIASRAAACRDRQDPPFVRQLGIR